MKDQKNEVYDANLLTAEEKAKEGVSYSYNSKEVTKPGVNLKGEKVDLDKIAQANEKATEKPETTVKP